MKIKSLIATAALLAALAAFSPAFALEASQTAKLKETVLSVPVPEMPAKAVELVKASDADSREAVAVTVVRAIVSKHRGAAPMVVSAISKAAPELSLAVAMAAVAEAPSQKEAIAAAVPEVANSVAFRGAANTPGQNASVSRGPTRDGIRGTPYKAPQPVDKTGNRNF